MKDITYMIAETINSTSIMVVLSVLVLILTAIIAYWLYNKRKFNQLTHQIPASVVKNYLDSIIANSTALKSSLFRGGGLELGEGIPSIIPTSDLPSGGVAVASDQSEEIAQKNAEIANLKSLLGQKDATIAELEKMLEAARTSNGGGISEEEANIMRGEIDSLKKQLEEANTALEAAKAAGGGGASSEDLDKAIAERDELKERLIEYEIIEEDLANLKKFQQENEQLKKTIEELKGGAPVAEEELAAEAPAPDPEPPAAEEAPAEEEPAPEPPPEATAEENPAADDSATEAAAEEKPDVPTNEGDQKSADELLSEFEKMLG